MIANSWQYVLILVIAVLASVYGSYTAARWMIWYFRRYIGMRTFFEVAPGKLYRSGQLSQKDLQKVKDTHGIKTIVCLRASTDEGKRNYWSAMEQNWSQQAGVRFVNLPCNDKNPPTDEQIDQFLELMSKDANLPVLLHCKLGRQRTGLMAAIYRMRFEGWTEAQAYKELDRFNFQPEKRKHQKLFEVLHRTAQRLKQLDLNKKIQYSNCLSKI